MVIWGILLILCAIAVLSSNKTLRYYASCFILAYVINFVLIIYEFVLKEMLTDADLRNDINFGLLVVAVLNILGVVYEYRQYKLDPY